MKPVSSPAAGARRVQRYFALLGWLGRDAFWRFRRPVTVVVGAGLGGVSLQGTAIGVALLYARAVESGDPVTIPLLARTFDPRTDALLLFGAMAGAGLLTAVAAVLIFWGRNSGIVADREYVRFATQRVLALMSRLPDYRSPAASASMHPAQVTELQRDIRYTGRIVRIVLRSVSSIVTALAAFVAVLVVNAALTAVVCVLVAVAGYGLYRVSTRGAAHSMTYEREMAASRQDRNAVLETLGTRPDQQGDAAELNLVDRPAYRRYLNAYYGRIRSTEWSDLITLILTAVALVLILFVEGMAILEGRSSFTSLILYLVALRYFLNGVTRTGRLAVAVNRFYPQAHRHMRFVLDASAATEAPTPVDLHGVRTRVPGLHDAAAQGLVERGGAVGLVHLGPLDRFVAARVVEGLQPVGPDDAEVRPPVSFVTGEAGVVDGDAQVLVVPAGTPCERLDEGVLVVAHQWPAEHLGEHGEQLHLVATRDEVVGWAPTAWIEDNGARLDELLPVRAATGGYLDEDDDDE